MTSAAPAPLEQLQLLLTERCNLRCTHCAVPEEDSPASFELSTSEWTAFIDNVLEASVRRIVLSGGEALLRPDCLEIAEHALLHGAETVVIVTNGTVLPITTVERLARLQDTYQLSLLLHVSLDGARPFTHDLIRGVGTFDRTLRGLDRLRRAGGRVDGVHTVVNRANVDELDEVADLARDLEARSWTVFPVAALGRGIELGDLRLTHDQWVGLLNRFAAQPPAELELGLMGPTVGDEWTDLFSIPAPRTEHSPQACVGPDGAVFTCPPLRDVEAGNARDLARGESWHGIDKTLRSTLATACTTCKYRSLCTGVDPASRSAVLEPLTDPAGVMSHHLPVSVTIGRTAP